MEQLVGACHFNNAVQVNEFMKTVILRLIFTKSHVNMIIPKFLEEYVSHHTPQKQDEKKKYLCECYGNQLTKIWKNNPNGNAKIVAEKTLDVIEELHVRHN